MLPRTLDYTGFVSSQDPRTLPGTVPPPVTTVPIRQLQSAPNTALGNDIAQPSVPTNQPVPDQFSSIIDLLKQYQSGGTTALNQAQQQQIGRGMSTPQSLIGASPSEQNAVRNASMEALSPTIGGARDVINAATKAISDYTVAKQQAKVDAQNVIHEAINAGSEAVNALLQSQPDLLKMAGYDQGTLQGVATSLRRREDLEASNKKYLDHITNPKNTNPLAPTTPTTETDNSTGFDVNVVKNIPGGKITSSGMAYVDPTNFTGKQKEAIINQATNAGVPVVDKDTASQLEALDVTKAQLNGMVELAHQVLSSSGGFNRLGTATRNEFEKITQIGSLSTQLSKFDNLRSKAVSLLQGLASGKGLRITKEEVDNVVKSLPAITDSSPYAVSKLQDILNWLGQKERAALVSNRQNLEQNQNTSDSTGSIYKGFKLPY